MILAVNLWKGTQIKIRASAPAGLNPSREMAEIRKCIELIQVYEPRQVYFPFPRISTDNEEFSDIRWQGDWCESE